MFKNKKIFVLGMGKSGKSVAKLLSKDNHVLITDMKCDNLDEISELEKLDGEGNFIGKADMFNKRTIKAKKQVLKVDTPDEALILSIQDKAKVDLEYMQKLCNIEKDEMIESLKGVIFRVPNYEKMDYWVTADEYLSGNVRKKLNDAEKFAKEDPSFNINVEKLKEVIPKDLGASEIGIKLGSTWIPPEVIRQFIFELLETPRYNRWDIKVKYSNITSEWYIEGKSVDRDNVKAYSTYGTSRINAYKIIEQTLNLKDVKIFDTIIDDSYFVIKRRHLLSQPSFEI